MEQDIIFLIVSLGSVVIGTVAGFGSSTILLPIALLFVDFKTAIILVAILHISGNLSKISIFKKGLDWKILAIFGIPSVLLSFAGASLIDVIPPDVMKFLLGVFLIIFSLMTLVKPQVKIPSNNQSLVAGGSLSGFLAGLIGTGGALRASFLTGMNLNKYVYIATSASIAFVTDATRIPVYLSQGFLLEQYYWYIPILIGIAALGAYIGKRIVNKINQDLFRKVVAVAIIFASIKFIIDGIVFLM